MLPMIELRKGIPTLWDLFTFEKIIVALISVVGSVKSMEKAEVIQCTDKKRSYFLFHL